mgnify:CR=1 FL=1
MKRNSYLYILVIFVAIMLFSCSQYQTITIENQEPAKYHVPEEIQSLTLMNRGLTSEFVNFREDSLQKYFYKRNYSVKTYVLDSLASDTCLQAAGKLLYESGRYDVVIPENRNIRRNSDFHTIEQPLGWNYVDSICKTYNTDALLVMEKFTTQVNTELNAEKNESSDGKYFYASFDICYDSFFRIYYPKKKEITGQFFMRDTIFWAYDDFNLQNIFLNIPPIKEGLIQCGIKVAMDLNDNISPSWIPDNRGLFVINNKNEEEKKWISKNNWDKLSEYWKPLTESKNSGIRSKAEFNMALASELNGRIDDAIQWAEKSLQTSFRNQTDIYLKKLKQRKAELNRIEQSKDQQ